MVTVILNILSTLFEAAGVAIITLGGIQAAIYFIREEKKKANLDKIEKARYILGNKLIVGLEFLLAGDLLTTVGSPSWDTLGKLAVLVVIRTVLSYFLEWEMRAKKHFSGKA